MKLANLHLLTAVLATVFGLAFLVAPMATLAQYGVTTDDAGIYMSRLLGAVYLGLGVLAWKARTLPADVASRAIVASLATMNVIGLPPAGITAVGRGNVPTCSRYWHAPLPP